jgi:hypothetical protein
MDQAQLQAHAAANKILVLDYPVRPRSRCRLDETPTGPLADRIAAGQSNYRDALAKFLPLRQSLAAIPATSAHPTEPHWLNGWIPAFDAISLYAFVALRKPALYLEVGSGTSTKFVRKAIADHGLRTKVVSIDPHPRSEIDAICDRVLRKPLEDTDIRVFDFLKDGDVVFFDGSHRALQNSDATVFLTEVVPRLKPGVLVGVHDIFLPWDYPPEWAGRYYSEQYLLACYLLGGNALSVTLPVAYCSQTPELHGILDPVWTLPGLAEATKTGALFWFTPQAPPR